jgi:pimeloyl-ACP methyl ester carboxylesterase
MKLRTQEWGDGDRVVVLIHGVMSDSNNWRRVGPALAERGYRVVAVDLRGHGLSPRADDYTIDLMADDVLESVPASPELVIGHSLGGMIMTRMVQRLRPARSVYVDPPFHRGKLPLRLRIMFALFTAGLIPISADRIAKMNPKWEADDVAAELESFARFDRRVMKQILRHPEWHAPPTVMSEPSLLILADRSVAVFGPIQAELEDLGFEVRVVPGAGHTVNRDEFDGFMAALDGWVEPEPQRPGTR